MSKPAVYSTRLPTASTSMKAWKECLSRLNEALAVGPTNSFGELPVLGDDGANSCSRAYSPRAAGLRSSRATSIQSGSSWMTKSALNPGMPNGQRRATRSADRLSGVMDYSFGNFKLAGSPVANIDSPAGLVQEVAPAWRQLTSWTCRAPSTSRTSPRAIRRRKFATPGDPDRPQPPVRLDILAMEEIQDNNGAGR